MEYTLFNNKKKRLSYNLFGSETCNTYIRYSNVLIKIIEVIGKLLPVFTIQNGRTVINDLFLKVLEKVVLKLRKYSNPNVRLYKSTRHNHLRCPMMRKVSLIT